MSLSVGADLDLAMATAFEENGWSNLLKRVMAEVGASGGATFVDDPEDRDTRRPFVLLPTRSSLPSMGDYFQRIGQDPQRRVIAAARGLTCYTDADHVDRSNHVTREYTDWEEATFGVRHHITIVAPHGLSRTVLCAHRRPQDGRFGSGERKIFGSYAATVELASRLSKTRIQSNLDAVWASERARNLASILIHRERKVVAATPRADDLLKRGELLRLGRRDDLEAVNDNDWTLLNSFLRILWGRGDQTSTGLRGNAAQICFSLNAIPLSLGGELPWCTNTAIVRIERIGGWASDQALSLLASLFGLTARERDVLRAVGRGMAPSILAQDLGISTATARVHLRTIFDKTGTHRQAELLKLLADYSSVS